MFRKKEMKYRGINVWVACLCLLLAACDKDENNNSNNFATGIVELPALRNGANDVFVTHYTTFNGQKVTSFSMEYDKSKKHSRWIIKQNSKMYHVVMSLLMLIQLLVHSINVYKQILENKVMTEDIFVLPPTDFIHVR